MIFINIIYFFILAVLAFSALFIVYHLFKYSYDKGASLLMFLVFTSVFSALLLLNLVLFFSIDWEDITSFNFL